MKCRREKRKVGPSQEGEAQLRAKGPAGRYVGPARRRARSQEPGAAASARGPVQEEDSSTRQRRRLDHDSSERRRAVSAKAPPPPPRRSTRAQRRSVTHHRHTRLLCSLKPLGDDRPAPWFSRQRSRHAACCAAVAAQAAAGLRRGYRCSSNGAVVSLVYVRAGIPELRQCRRRQPERVSVMAVRVGRTHAGICAWHCPSRRRALYVTWYMCVGRAETVNGSVDLGSLSVWLVKTALERVIVLALVNFTDNCPWQAALPAPRARPRGRDDAGRTSHFTSCA